MYSISCSNILFTKMGRTRRLVPQVWRRACCAGAAHHRVGLPCLQAGRCTRTRSANVCSRGWINSFPPQKCTFPHNWFSTHFFSMKMAEFWKMVCIIDFDDIQLCLRQFCLNLNICKVMPVFLIFFGQNLKKIVITLQILRLKQNCLRQSWISSK